MNKMIAMTMSAGATTAAADRTGKGGVHHAGTGRDQHEEERAEHLREETAPLLTRVVEVFNSLVDVALVASDRTRLGDFLWRAHRYVTSRLDGHRRRTGRSCRYCRTRVPISLLMATER